MHTGNPLALHLRGLAGACFANHYDNLALSDDLQQLITAVIDRQEAALLLQSPALCPVTDSLQNPNMPYASTQNKGRQLAGMCAMICCACPDISWLCTKGQQQYMASYGVAGAA